MIVVVIAIVVIAAVLVAVWRLAPSRRNTGTTNGDPRLADKHDEIRAEEAMKGRGFGGANSPGTWGGM